MLALACMHVKGKICPISDHFCIININLAIKLLCFCVAYVVFFINA